jgi:hypothetical protein
VDQAASFGTVYKDAPMWMDERERAANAKGQERRRRGVAER